MLREWIDIALLLVHQYQNEIDYFQLTKALRTCSPWTLRGKKPYNGSFTFGGAEEFVYRWLGGRGARFGFSLVPFVDFAIVKVSSRPVADSL